MIFACPLCGLVKLNTESLEAHVSQMHLDFTPYRCLSCDAKWPTRIKIEEHCRVAHGQSNPAVLFDCDSIKSAGLRRLMETALANAGRNAKDEDLKALNGNGAGQSEAITISSLNAVAAQAQHSSTAAGKLDKVLGEPLAKRPRIQLPKKVKQPKPVIANPNKPQVSFFCRICKKAFLENTHSRNSVSMQHLCSHMAKIYGDYRYACRLCTYQSAWLVAMKKHHKDAHFRELEQIDDRIMEWDHEKMRHVSRVCYDNEEYMIKKLTDELPPFTYLTDLNDSATSDLSTSKLKIEGAEGDGEGRESSVASTSGSLQNAEEGHANEEGAAGNDTISEDGQKEDSPEEIIINPLNDTESLDMREANRQMNVS